MNPVLSPSALLCAALIPVAALAQKSDAPAAPGNFVDRPAIFTVTTDVLNAGLEAFTITGAGFGNSLKRPGKGGFEPFSFRNQLTAAADSPDTITVGSGGGLAFYDSFASGYLDGAEVRVYRIVGGELKLARTDRVPEGGTVIEEWRTTSAVIAPDATTAGYVWDSWTRPGAERWFTVFAINADGTLSEAGNTVKLAFTPAAKGAKADNKTIDFKAPRKLAGLPAPAAPSDVRLATDSDGIVRATWSASPAPGVVGYKIGYTDTDPSKHRGAYIRLSRQPSTPEEAIKKGDMIIVAKDMDPFRAEYLSNRLGGLDREIRNRIPAGVPNALAGAQDMWRLPRHEAGTPVEDAGQTYLEMTLKEGETQKVGLSGIPDLSTTTQTYYPVPDRTEYTMEVWMKADRADAPPVVFEHDGDKRVGGFVKPHSMQVGTTWKKYTHTFMGEPSDNGHHAYLVLTATGPATYSFDNFRVFRSDTAYLDYGQQDYDRLRDSGMMAYRTHHPIKTGTRSYSMEQFLGPNGSVEGVAKGTSLGGVLDMMRKARIRPWLQIEFHMSPAEWLGFAEFMAAPYDPAKDSPETKPWAYKRFKQGRQAPWTDAFDRLYFELGNETWNSLFAPWTFSGMTDSATGATLSRGSVYGLFHDHVVGILRSSPWWTGDVEAKFVQILGGWTIGSYNDEIARVTRTGDFITVAAYNGGWDAGEGPPRRNPASFFSVLNFANQSAIPSARGLLENAIKWETATGRRFQIGTYEAGPGYALNGLNNAKVTREQTAEQEAVMKSKAAGVATLDTFLAQAAYDYDIQNFFTFSEGSHWTSHVKSYSGGHAHPSFLYLSLFNREGLGDLLRISTDNVPTVDLPAFRRRKAVDGAPAVAAYATRQGDRVNLFVLSRRYPGYPEASGDGFTPFGLQLPFTKASRITLHRATGAPDDTNLEGEKVRLESIAIAPTTLRPDGRFVVGPDTGGDARGLPPAEAFLYVFEGTDIGAPGKEFTREDITKLPTTFVGK